MLKIRAIIGIMFGKPVACNLDIHGFIHVNKKGSVFINNRFTSAQTIKKEAEEYLKKAEIEMR